MGNQAGRAKSYIDANVTREMSDLAMQYRSLKGDNERLSVKKLRLSEMSMLSGGRKSQDIERMMDQIFPDQKYITFLDYIKLQIKKGGSSEELSLILETLFREIDDGDGLLTVEELVNLEASLDFKLTVDQADKIIKTYDSDGDGRMSFDEFFYYYSSTQRT